MVLKHHDRFFYWFSIIGWNIALIILLFSISGKAIAQQPVPEKKNAALHLTLEDAIRLALQENRSLLGANYGLERQQLSLQSILSDFDIKFRPASQVLVAEENKAAKVGVVIDKKFEYGMSAAIAPGISWTDDFSSGDVDMSLRIPLFRGLGKDVTLDGVYSSQFSLRSSVRSVYASQVNVILATVFSLYDVIKQRELVRLFEFQAAQLEGHASIAGMKEKVGLATPIDVYRAEIRLKDAETGVASAYEAFKNAEDNLKLILSIPIEKPITVSAPLTFKAIGIDLDAAVKISLNNRIELIQKKDELEETERKSGIARHNLLPQVDLVVDYRRFSLSDEFENSIGLGEDFWRISLTSSTDWARTSEKISYEQSLISVKTAKIGLQLKQDEIITEVRRQFEALKKSLERISLKKEQIRQAEGKLALAKVKFNYDMAGNFDVIESETELQRGKVDLLSSKIDYIEGTYKMRAALGTLIEPPEG